VVPITARLYDHLFCKVDPDDVEEGKTWLDNLNPDSKKVMEGFCEPFVQGAKPLDRFQFERLGYFCVDPDSTESKLLFNRTATLRDAWANIQKKK